MMAALSGWLLRVTACALLLAAAEVLMPDGQVRQIGRLTGGLLLFLVLVGPVLSLELDGVAEAFADYQTSLSDYSESLEETNQSLTEEYISKETAAYIEDKAAELGGAVTAEVTCAVDEDGLTLPVSAVVTGSLTGEQEAELRVLLEEELNIIDVTIQEEVQ